MKLYFAPLEGITGFTFRQIHRTHFTGIDTYFTPFLSAKQTLSFENKEKKDIDPANNQGTQLIPQIMANKADQFVWAAKEIQSRGYEVVNLNLGCPMPTIVTKRKGSGMLADIDELKRFLDGIFDGCANGGPRLSIKTRLGKDNLDDACRLGELYNDYPLDELIIHPRCQKDLYKVDPNLDVFESVMQITKHDVCYNGNIFCQEDLNRFITRFDPAKYPQIKAIMLGRGIVAQPALARILKGGKPASKTELKSYHDALFTTYCSQNLGDSTVLHRMKELWFYIGHLFNDAEKPIHKIRIAKSMPEYKAAVERTFSGYQLGGHFQFP